jgi:hypothetical protein
MSDEAFKAETFTAGHDGFERAVRASFTKQGLLGGLGAWLVDVPPA